MEEEKRPGVGIGVVIIKNNKVLLGKSCKPASAGQYTFPGGKLEYLESFADCAIRETAEECGLEITNLRFQYLANVQEHVQKKHVHINLLADWKSGEPQNLEPDKCEGWAWYDMEHLPTPLSECAKPAILSLKTGKNYFDA